MKNYLLFLIIIVIGFTSCEDRKSKSQALYESIKEFKKTVNLESHVYIPNTYFELEVDTLISNGYRVKIKTYTDMSHSVLFSKIKDTINYQTHYRNFKFDIAVFKNEKEIYQETFNKDKVNKTFNSNLDEASGLYNFDELAILKSIQINENPIYSNMVAIDILYAIPESDKSVSHTLFIDSKGKSNIVQIEVK